MIHAFEYNEYIPKTKKPAAASPSYLVYDIQKSGRYIRTLKKVKAPSWKVAVHLVRFICKDKGLADVIIRGPRAAYKIDHEGRTIKRYAATRYISIKTTKQVRQLVKTYGLLNIVKTRTSITAEVML